MLALLGRLEEWLVATERLVIFLAVLLLLVDLTAQVVSRYALPVPLAYTVELSRVGLIWLVFIGSAHATYLSEHFFVGIFLDRVRYPERAWIETVVELLVIVFFGWLAYQALQLTVDNPQIYPALNMPVAIAYVALPIGAGAILFHSVMMLLRKRYNYHLNTVKGVGDTAELQLGKSDR